LITPEGEARLRAELHELWHVRRPQVTRSVSEAAAQGDRSENAEYTYGKKMLREIDSRVRFLSKRLENLKVVDQPPSEANKVYFGAWVTLEDEAGEQQRYRIVGPDELDLKQGLISIDSPLARALLGKLLDAEIRVQTPTGEKCWYLVAIEYR
jgi:transcription elongation factor GreB